MPFGHVTLCFRDGKRVKILLIRLFEVDAHLFHGGEDHERIHVKILRQAFACKILVDHCGNAFEIAFCVAHDGNAAAAHGHNDKPIIHQTAHRVKLNDFDRHGGGDDAPPAADGVLLHDITLFRSDGCGFFFRIKRADGL